MYFWRIEELKAKLVAAPLTDREVLPYLIVFLVLVSAVSLFPPATMNVWDYLINGYALLLSLFGTLYLYQKNGGNAGVQFLQRYMAVGWVAAVRWSAFFIPSYIAVEIAFGTPDETSLVSFAYVSIASLVLYQRIGFHIADVASRKAHARSSAV